MRVGKGEREDAEYMGCGQLPQHGSGLSLIAAPLVLLAALLVHPGEGGFVQTVAENPGRVEISNLLIILSSVLFVPGLVGVLRLVRGRGVVLAHVGVGLAVIGVVGHAVWAGFQLILVATIRGSIPREQLTPMVEGGPPSVGFIVVMLMFLVGFSWDWYSWPPVSGGPGPSRGGRRY
jgi:hypothetical protein